MKKISVLLAFLVVALCFVGCGKSQFYGTWEVSGCIINDEELTIEQAHAEGDYTLDGTGIVFTKDGVAYMYDSRSKNTAPWGVKGNTITIGKGEMNYKGGKLYLFVEKTGNAMIFSKKSNSQEKPW